jgi:hypothetical protein
MIPGSPVEHIGQQIGKRPRQDRLGLLGDAQE